jgi:hypothetical protein
MKHEHQIRNALPRWRSGRLVNPIARRPWLPVTDTGLGSADDRVWARIEPSALDWFDDGSWISRARSMSRQR